METARLRIGGRWGHFKKPETNNNPLTHDFITKTALIGMVGAVLGIERGDMRELFPRLSEDLRYGVALENRVWKQTWAFTLRRFDPDKSKLEPSIPAPRAFEFLREPSFIVILSLADSRSAKEFRRFVELVGLSETYYEPVLGLHNCPAQLELLNTGDAEPTSGPFETPGFVPRDRQRVRDIKPGLRIGFERIPTYQNSDMWNRPDRYIEVVYADVSGSGQSTTMQGDGEHFEITFDRGATQEAWCLV